MPVCAYALWETDMDDDIVDRLSDAQAQCERCPNCCHCDLHQDAIDEILRLRAYFAELREAVDEYKHRLHWANEELLKRGRP